MFHFLPSVVVNSLFNIWEIEFHSLSQNRSQWRFKLSIFDVFWRYTKIFASKLVLELYLFTFEENIHVSRFPQIYMAVKNRRSRYQTKPH